MFAARDQENRVHAFQTTAAAKPLNHDLRTLHPKTPGNTKTPFRAKTNDENRPIEVQGQKKSLKDEPSKLDKNAFVTPIEPRTRAPLGLKTGNAKAQVFKTPAPGQQTAKSIRTFQRPSTTRRPARSKIIIAPSETVETDVLDAKNEEEKVEDDEPDYGYAPPPPVELPDPPMEFDYDHTFPQFQGANFFRGYGEIYFTSPKDESGISLRLKKEEERYERHTQEQIRSLEKTSNHAKLASNVELNLQVDEMIRSGPKARNLQESQVNTIKAKCAASALSDSTQRLPSVAMKQTKSSEQKQKPVVTARPAKFDDGLAARSSKITTPPIVSRNTIGFPKAKQARSILPPTEQLRNSHHHHNRKSRLTEVDQSKIHPKDFRDLYGEPPVESDMWFRLREYELLDEILPSKEGDELADDLFDTDFFPISGMEHDDEDFQLPLPE